MARIALILFLVVCSTRAALHGTFAYSGMCDASAAVPLDDKYFVAADDEGNVLRVYERGKAEPVRSVNLTRFLLGKKKGGETDLEGGTRVGDLIYWISSHGRDKNGKVAPHRHQFFAVRVIGNAILEPIGRSYTKLQEEIFSDARFARYDFRAADKESAFNIEGMCARADGSLLIAFRKPVPSGKGLLLPLLNPEKVVLGEKPQFGEMIELELGGYGVRDIMLDGERFLIVGAHKQTGSDFRLFTWDGKGKADMVPEIAFGKLSPEGIFRFPDDPAGRYQVLSDDGERRIGGKECKDLPPEQRHFRASEFTLHP